LAPDKNRLILGKNAEKEAVAFLEKSGYIILHTNFRSCFGEIDIIARENDTIVFVEVKSRSSDRFGLPQEAVSALKQRQISKTALEFLRIKGLFDKRARFDVVSCLYSGGKLHFGLIKNAFGLEGSYTI